MLSSTLLLFYDDKEGAKMRMQERQRKQDNF